MSRRIGDLLCIFLSAVFLLAPLCQAQLEQPTTGKVTPQDGDYVLRDFHFKSGETLPELRMHYLTLGKPARDASGRVTNAVLILHGTTGSGRQFLAPQFADVLFGPGQLLDASRYFIILPDNIGHGKSSKPSDGLHAHFPQYDYDDMVLAQHELLVQGLGVSHLRLVMGTSMGCMHSWVWAKPIPTSWTPSCLLPACRCRSQGAIASGAKW
jgi:homoserine O-acetyltransferase/O-succinyltransferase